MDWNNCVENTNPRTSPDRIDAEYRCGLCNKSWGRRDLRDRHRRRCAKTFGQARASKRKSCERCSSTKLRCSLTRPSCSRCVQMGSACHYPNPSSIHGDQDTGPELMTSAEESTSTGLDPVAPVVAMAMPGNNSQSTSGMDGITWNPELDNIDLMLPSMGDGTGFPGQATWPGPGSGFVGEYVHGQMASFCITPQEDPKTHHSRNNPSMLIPGNSLDIPLPPLSSSGSSSHREPSAGRDDTETSNSGGIFASSFTPDLSGPALLDTTNLSKELFGILYGYPLLMQQPEFWSPFIHHRLYRCSKDGMAQPLGIAVACVGAYSSRVESSCDFIDNMINTERERLLREFHLYNDRPETCLAALHAVCVYQILGLFGNSSPNSGHNMPFKDTSERRREDSAKVAELHSSFLLKMTRRLCKVHQKALGGNEPGWEEWKFAESLRRNVFFIHIINILAAKARKLHYDYFEPLDDAMVLQLPLPAPEYMWRACSEEEWRVAREYARPSSPTLHTLQELLDSDRLGSLNVSSLQPLIRMILASHKIRPRGYDGEVP